MSARPVTTHQETAMSSLHSLRRLTLCGSIAAALILGPLTPARAQSEASATLSAASMLPVAVSVAAPVMILSAGATLTVVAVEVSATGTVYVLERASDGARASLRFAGRAAGAVSAGIGTAVLVTAISTGYVLSAASEAIAFVPNEIGASLLYNERITR